MKSYSLFLLCTPLFCFSNNIASPSSSHSQTGSDSGASPLKRCSVDYSGAAPNDSLTIKTDQLAKIKAICYGSDRTSLNLLFEPDYFSKNLHRMIDLSWHQFRNQTNGANLGFIIRSKEEPMIGGNIYYDYRQGYVGNYHQIGLGFECLGKKVDFRVNGYFPIGTKQHQEYYQFDSYIGSYFAIQRGTESVDFCSDFELGFLVKKTEKFTFHVAIGGYALGSVVQSGILGAKLRVTPSYKDYCSIDLNLSYDSIFGFVPEIIAKVSVPLYQISSKSNPKEKLNERAKQVYQPVRRFPVPIIQPQDHWQTNKF